MHAPFPNHIHVSQSQISGHCHHPIFGLWQTKPGEFIAICEVYYDFPKALQFIFSCFMMQRKTNFDKFFSPYVIDWPQ